MIPFYQQRKQVLQDYNASLAKAESLGVLIETENAKLSSAYKHAHEPHSTATFIGYSPRGTHMYVSYFDGRRCCCRRHRFRDGRDPRPATREAIEARVGSGNATDTTVPKEPSAEPTSWRTGMSPNPATPGPSHNSTEIMP